MSSSRRPAWLSTPQTIALFLAAVAMRVLALRWPGALIPGGVPFNPDERWYRHLALEWAAGHGFDPGATAMTISLARWPGYPVALGTLYRVFGDGAWVAWSYHILLGAGTCVLLAWTAARLARLVAGAAAARPAAWCTGALVAVHPFLLAQTRPTMTEAQYTFCAALAMAALVWCLEAPSPRRAAVLGVTLGLACLTRASGVVLVPALLLALPFARGSRRQRAATFLTLLAVLAVAVSPWAIRNALVWHRFVPLGTGGGYLFFSGNSVYGEARFLLHRPLVELPFFDLMRVHDDRWFVGQALSWIAVDPGRFVHITLAKAAVLWKVWPAWRSWLWSLPAIALYAGPPVAAAAGVTLALRRSGAARAAAVAALAVIAATTALFALTIPDMRYRVPTIDLWLWVWAGVAGARVLRGR